MTLIISSGFERMATDEATLFYGQELYKLQESGVFVSCLTGINENDYSFKKRQCYFGEAT